MVSKWHDVITFICNRTCKLKHWWIYQEMLYHKNISPQYGQPSVCAFFGKAVFHPGSALQTLDEYITLLLTCCHVKMTMNRTSVFLPERKTENVQAKKARPTNPNPRSTNWRPDNYSLPSWGIGQICRCSSLLASPRGYTRNLYGCVPTKIILLDSCVPLLPLSPVSHSFSPSSSRLTLNSWSRETVSLATISGRTRQLLAFDYGRGVGLMHKHCVGV